MLFPALELPIDRWAEFLGMGMSDVIIVVLLKGKSEVIMEEISVEFITPGISEDPVDMATSEEVLLPIARNSLSSPVMVTSEM